MVVINQAPVAPPGMLKLLLPISLASLLVACSTGDDSATAAKSDKVLHVYNWADYIAESTIQDFEARTGIRVVYDVYDASEVLETKLLTGSSGYDAVRAGARMPSASQPVPHERWHD
jgi:putrescine transport system substrate-binding protein